MTKRAACAWWPHCCLQHLPRPRKTPQWEARMSWPSLSSPLCRSTSLSSQFVGEHHRREQKNGRTRNGKPSTEYRQYLDHKHHCSQNLDLPAALRDATCVRWIVGWDLWQFITLWDSVECLLWNTGRRLQIIPAESAERPLRKHTTASEKMRQSESIFLRAEGRQAN